MNWSKRGTAETRAASALRAPVDVVLTSLALAEPDDGVKPSGVAATDGDAQASELAELRLYVTKLETRLETYRAEKELLSEAIVDATRYARNLREDARRDAELALSKARARAEEVLGGLEREKQKAESELIRLRRVSDETRAALTAFLTAAMEGLRFDEPDSSSESAPQPGLTEALHDVLEDTVRKEAAPPAPSPLPEGSSPGHTP